MMSLGPIAFLSPWLLGALVALPVIWWLLRVTPPAPRRIAFPPTRILVGIERREEDRAHSPWWLTAIRLAAAAAVIFALARPVLNPQLRSLHGADLNILVIDDGWAAARDWPQRLTTASELVEQLAETNRPLLLLTTADPGEQANATATAAVRVREQLAGLVPKPWSPDRAALRDRLEKALKQQPNAHVYYIADSLDYGPANAQLPTLAAAAGGADRMTLIVDRDGTGAPFAIAVAGGGKAQLAARVIGSGETALDGRVLAADARGRVLASQPFSLKAGATSLDVDFDLPLELRNQVARLEIEGLRSAGAVFLLDGEAARRRIGLVSGESSEEAQPLLSSLYYLRKALAPFAELAVSNDRNTADAVTGLLRQNVSLLALAGIGRIGGATASDLEDWIGRGGILVRFAGPRLEQSGDDLLPVRLREGERTLGGALSWSQPQKLAPFEQGSPFYGLAAADDVTVARQVLADPASLDADSLIWARLADGTPLVTAKKLGRGLMVLFHVTANSDWSSLPHSGLFVDMLRRLSALSAGVVADTNSGGATAKTAATAAVGDDAGSPVLPPLQLLDGFGRPTPATASAEPVRLAELATIRPSAVHPPGLYGAGDLTRALNLAAADTVLTPLVLPAGLRSEAISRDATRPLAPPLLTLALLLFLADALAVTLLRGLIEGRAPAVRNAALLAGAVWLGALSLSVPHHAQAAERSQHAPVTDDTFALETTLETRLAFVRSGDPVIDRDSYQGLAALSRQLARRTALEPGEPVGVDVRRDELAFFPLLYWPVPDNVDSLDDTAIARINAYMKQGGLILFDSRDEIATPTASRLGGNSSRLARLIGKLDLPPLEPVANDHVLMRSFYLLDAFPGRWAGGSMWAEAPSRAAGGADDSPTAQNSDGVSSILVTSNDLAGAWAENDDGSPLHPVIPGGEAQREMAYRAGINVVMYALTGNYKADQVHLPALMRRLGQ